MAWTDLSLNITTLLTSAGFTASDEVFDLSHLPSTCADKAFSIQCGSLHPVDQNDNALSCDVTISAQFEIGNSNVTLYNAGIANCEAFIVALKNSNITGNNELQFTGATIKLDKDENFISADIQFIAYYII